MHSILKATALLFVAAFILTTFAYADLPYSIQWLQYANERIVYQVNTSDINSNTANIYVTLNIDPTTLQNYINKWSDYCDPSGYYPWFYPTFTYASTANQTPRFAQTISYTNYQTFNIGSCGTVDLPTTYTVKLPNGILDGGDNYASYQHYIYANLKTPYTYDFSDVLPDTVPPYLSNASITYHFDPNNGVFLSSPSITGDYLEIQRTVDTTKPFYICTKMSKSGQLIPEIWGRLCINDTNCANYGGDALVGEHCVDVSSVLHNLSDSTNTQLYKYGIYNDAYTANIYYIRILLPEIVSKLRGE